MDASWDAQNDHLRFLTDCFGVGFGRFHGGFHPFCEIHPVNPVNPVEKEVK